jgi:chromosome segregation ATPase
MGALMGPRTLEDVQADIAEITATISKLKRDFNDGKYKEGILDEQVNAYEDEITKMTRTGNYKVPDLRQKRQAQQQARAQSIDLMRAGESIQYRITTHKKRLEELNYELSGFQTARSTPPPA